MKFIFIAYSYLLLPGAALAAELVNKRVFFPGRSWYFWLFVGIAFFVTYHYYTSANKKEFFKSPLILGLTLTTSILFFTYMGANLFIGGHTSRDSNNPNELRQLLNSELKLRGKAEYDFTNPEVHDQYINTHFLIPQTYLDSLGRSITRDDYSIQNLYFDKLTFTDSTYVQMGYYGLGIYFYKTKNNWNARQFFSKIKNNIPYVNHYKALIAIELDKDAEALGYLQKAITERDKYWNYSYQQYISILLSQNKKDVLSAILHNPDTRQFIPLETALAIYLNEGNIVRYYLLIVSNTLKGFKATGIFAALLILAVWLAYIIRVDVFEREKFLPQTITLLFGMSSVWVVFLVGDFTKFVLGIHNEKLFLNDLLFFIIKVGLVEESVKILPLVFLVVFLPKLLSEAYDYILYASISALGFAFVENLLYFQQDLTNIIFVRALTSVPGHMIDSSIVAYGFVLSRYRFRNFPLYLSFPIFLLFGSVVHGLYDFWAFTHTLSLFLFHLLLSVSFWIIIINNCINNSPFFSYRMKFKSEKLQLFMAVALTLILALQYLVLSLELGPQVANQSLNSTLMIGGLFIVYYTDKLTNMDLVKGYWNTINFKSIGDLRRNTKFNLRRFLIRLISGDIIPHSFVGNTVELYSNAQNAVLSMYLPIKTKATIIDRVVVLCTPPNTGKSYKDPYWFIINTEHPILLENRPSKVFIFRFQEDAPSFAKENDVPIYLFSFKDIDATQITNISREDLLSLGKANIRK